MPDSTNIALSELHDWLSLKRAWDSPEDLAMHFLARTQGIAIVTILFSDREFLCREIEHLIQWLDKTGENS